ncbi:galactose/glucose ABC transporter substrate-binding protein MglB [Clostridium tarantellae]|uniref:D-galactose/methyl-galactoside binding periplasmic protein MglB n=1 Tax=Clostridium tarantellae TaxID=39493 RepID=A0A6I1MRZ1_9CLOT|nr:galactose/glucose ABC transporter substrate-binding protein MglB [Clostridium tarantellae]MPQ43049.1 galactose/glucose ABC transporter substrate-binding protein MglB [Clostridium tarantellae]
MKKRSLALFLVATLSMGTLIGCGDSDKSGDSNASGSSSESTENNKKGDKIKIGATIYKYDDNFMSYLRRGIEKAVKSKDVDLIINDSQNDQAKQLEQIDTMIAKGVNVLAINLVDPKAAPSVIEKAKQNDLPVVFFNKEPDENVMKSYDKVWYVGTDSKESGVIQGKLMIDDWKANPEWDKNGDGKVQYVMLKGEPGHPDAEARTQYSVEEFKNAGIDTEELAIDTGMWDAAKATEKMDAWVSKSGEAIELVICNNDGMALGALSSIEKAGYNIPIYGVDAIPEVLEKIKADKIAGSVLNDSKGQAEAVVNLAVNVANGKDPLEGTESKLDDKKAVRVPYVGINKANVNIAEETYK